MVSPIARSHVAATLVFAASVLLMVGKAPAWCLAIAAAAAVWRLLVESGRIAAPKARPGARFMFGAVTAALVVAVAVSFSTLNGLAAGSALLLVMGALKLLEARSRRDDGIVVGVGLFMLIASILASQSLASVPIYLLVVWGACAAIAIIADVGGALAPRAAMRLAARALAMSIPLAVACFLFFPRLSGQFWALQRNTMGSTGVTDEMSPGAIGILASEYDPAFRVRFEGDLPPRSALYFRGPVLNAFDGFTWRRQRSMLYAGGEMIMLGEPVRYRITLEPTDRPYLFSLDTLARNPQRGMFMAPHDRQLSATAPVTSAFSYDAVSHLQTRTVTSLSALGRRLETALPPDRNPRTRALALKLRARSASDRDYARSVLNWFRDNGLEYSLEPGVTSIDSVDSTLFDSKLGFCGHFASAYAMMMRVAGVPARVVTGYLGGEWNSIGGYLIVRQSDAHAWTEVWLEGDGWVRIDPTGIVSPGRLERGVFETIPDSLPAASRLLRSSPFLLRMQLVWDGANHWWRERVVEFNERSQINLLRKLGIDSPDWRHLGWAFTAGLLAWIAWVSLSLRRSVARVKPDRIGRAWLRATRKLARVAPPREPAEGPLAYARRVGEHRPDLAATVIALTTNYVRLRFGPEASNHDIAELEREVARLAVPQR
jgi:transglutaminase-like putative cysteine protease